MQTVRDRPTFTFSKFIALTFVLFVHVHILEVKFLVDIVFLDKGLFEVKAFLQASRDLPCTCTCMVARQSTYMSVA